jgi:hypothetical protein
LNRTILKRIEALESRRRDEYKPIDMSGLYAHLDVLLIGKRTPMLRAYAKRCRYRGGVEKLMRIAADDPGRFYRKHVKIAMNASRDAVERIRQFVLSYIEPAPDKPAVFSPAARAFLAECDVIAERLKAAKAA